MDGIGLEERLAAIQLLVLDVDGVLTDGRMLLDADGRESVRFDIQDGYGIVHAQRDGLRFAIISGRDTPAVRVRAAQLGIEDLHLGAVDKMKAFSLLLQDTGVPAERMAFMGDDLNDMKVMDQVAVVCAPANARDEVRQRADLVTAARGGEGAVREVIERILDARSRHG